MLLNVCIDIFVRIDFIRFFKPSFSLQTKLLYIKLSKQEIVEDFLWQVCGGDNN